MRKMEPHRDLDIVKINELHNHIINRVKVDLDRIGEFNVDNAQFVGFDQA